MRTLRFSRFLLLVVAMLAFSAAAFAQIGVGVSVSFGPPELPVYDQPVCPGDGYIWTPGYWAWDGDDYYWVPGTWIEAPEVGYLWTPGYWGWEGGGFLFHDGYWGPQIGFYGGINYGFGYYGHGYEGGRWDNGHFFYNRSVNNVNVTVIHNVYNTTIVNRNETRVSFNGGNGGVNVRASAAEEAAARERHVGPVAAQNEHVQAARSNRELHASANHGKPPIAATERPGAFNGGGVVAAREGGKYNPPPNRGAASTNRPENNQPNNNRPENTRAPENNVARPANPIHPNEIPPGEKRAPYNTGSPNLDKKYQQQQDKLQAKQQQDHQKLQQKQEQDHQRLAKQQVDDARKQQVEQQHQQQTQQLEQRHQQQQQQLEQRQQPPHQAPPAQHENPPKK